MPTLNVVVAATRPDLDADGLARAVAAAGSGMRLVGGRYVDLPGVPELLDSLPADEPSALILYGKLEDTARPAEEALDRRKDLAVLRVNSVGDVRFGATLHRLGHPEIFAQLRRLVERVVELRRARPEGARLAAVGDMAQTRSALPGEALAWLHARLRHAVTALHETRGDLPWTRTTRESVLAELDGRDVHIPGAPEEPLVRREAALDKALERDQPLARAYRALGLSGLELRILLLALAPELDPVYQRCLGLVQDDMGRRVGGLGVFAEVLGVAPEVRASVTKSAGLVSWRLLDGGAALPAADELLRLDPPFCDWLLGRPAALVQDPRVRRLLRADAWRGARVLDRPEERARASDLVRAMRPAEGSGWLLLDEDDGPAWRAVVELGAVALGVEPIRVELARVGGLEPMEAEESAVRLARAALLSDGPLVIDALLHERTAQDDEPARRFLGAVGRPGVRAALIVQDGTRGMRLLGGVPYAIAQHPALGRDARVVAMRSAAAGAGVRLDAQEADSLARRFPLAVDAIEEAMGLAEARAFARATSDERLARFEAALKELAAEGVSRLAERIEPGFALDDVVLPADRRRQLDEIVDSIRFAGRVLDEWKFGEQLPYGRGVTALFHGASGTGKTMAAMGVARALGVQILRLDLSRVLSKYIGDTEKHIDVCFGDAERSGSAILVDEADALLSRRSEVKDAHDRYANIEVAYLLQRMEAFQGLAILTTNLRKNLDPAFLRRLRFIVDFPRPDAQAREAIWRRCLPPQSHELDDAAFRMLARRVELTGGHIRQITLRAAFAAAAAGTPIMLGHIAHASQAELEKLGMPAVDLQPDERRKAA